MKRKNIVTAVLIVLAFGSLVALAGCAEQTNEQSQQANKIASSSGQNISNIKSGVSYYYEVKVTEKNQRNLVKKQPPFTMDYSLERQNLIRRYKYLNDRNNVHHVYLMSEGQVVAYYVAQGKVSSVNSKLTNDKQLVKVPNPKFEDYHGGGANGANWKVVESPQMDGSYGTNGEAIFFFTTDGAYVQTNLKYVVSERPMNINDEVILVQTNKTST